VWPSEFTELPKSATASINAPEASSIPLAAAPHLKPATPPPLAAEKPTPPSPPSPFTFEEPTPPPPKTGAGADLGDFLNWLNEQTDVSLTEALEQMFPGHQ